MKNKTGRRAFIKKISAGGTAALFSPGVLLTDQTKEAPEPVDDEKKDPQSNRKDSRHTILLLKIILKRQRS